MKSTCQVIIFGLTFLALAASADAQSPREQLTQMVQQLQQTPNDTALREKIIKLATSIKPAPVIPEEARRAFVRGNATMSEAKTPEEYARAIQLYTEASVIAPWWGDPYFNLAKAHELRQEYDAAILGLRFFLLAGIAGNDARQAQDQIYVLEEKRDRQVKQAAAAAAAVEQANSLEARAAREKEAEQRFIASLEGAIYVCPEWPRSENFMSTRPEIEIRNGKIIGTKVITWIRPGEQLGGTLYLGSRVGWIPATPLLQGKVTIVPDYWGELRFEIYDDRLVVTGSERSQKPVGPCRRK